MVLIFDMDGVIVDNHQWHFEAYIEFGKRHNLKITKEEFGNYFGTSNHFIMKSIFGESITEEDIITFGEEKESIYREMYKPFIRPLQGLPEFLHYASKHNIPVALATAAPAENVKFTLRETGLESNFNVITDASMVSRGKPDPQVYLITAAKLGVQPADCIVFEDSIPGIMAAQNAGMQVIGVSTTHNPEELLKYVDEIIMNFEGAERIIEQRCFL
jgi:beta-phosphoglucomutase